MTPPLEIPVDIEVKSTGGAIPLVPAVDFDIVVEEVKEEKAPLMVRLVEDFSLQSESDEDDEEEVEEIKSEMITAAQPPADIQESCTEIVDVEVKKEVTEEEEAEKVLVSNEEELLVDDKPSEDELLVDEKSKVHFLDTLCLQSVSSLRNSDLGSKEASASRRTLNQYHQVGFIFPIRFLR